MVTPTGKKILIRSIALIIAVCGGFIFLSGADKPIDWLEYDAEQVSRDIEEGRPVLIKFTADWCTTCTVIDKFVYSKKDVAELLKQKGVRPYLADTTFRDDAATLDLKDVYKEPGVPVSILHLPDGKQEHLPGMFGKDELRELLEPLIDAEGFDGEEENGKEEETESS